MMQKNIEDFVTVRKELLGVEAELAELEKKEVQEDEQKARIIELRRTEEELFFRRNDLFDEIGGKVVVLCQQAETGALTYCYGTRRQANYGLEPHVVDKEKGEIVTALSNCLSCAPEALRLLESLGVIQTDDNLILYQPTREFWARTSEGWRKIE